MSSITAFEGEVQLLRWSESHNNGATVTFQLSDNSDLDKFRSITVRKGKVAGQRFICVLVEIDENEQPVVQEQKKGGELAKLAAMLCQNDSFRQWATKEFSEEISSEEQAKALICRICNITSRAELDNNEGAADLFHNSFRKKYLDYAASGYEYLPTIF